jgi:hypothetical protein
MPNGDGRHPKDRNKFLDPPWTDNHMEGFNLAMEDALDGWDKNENQDFQVRFSVKAKKLHNPGGVKEYRVTIQTN